MLLEGAGYRVLTSTGGAAGLDLLQSSNVHAVILDYLMPGMDGAEVARTVRQKWPELPIVLLSGYPDEVPEDVLRMVNAFVTKGGTPQQLLMVLEGALSRRDLRKVTILNVDDSDEHRYAVTRVLRNAGFNVVEAKTGREALDMMSPCPSLVILDVNLPDMLGFEVARHIKANVVTRAIPIIHLSATYPEDLGAPESAEAGAARFLEHPDDLLELVEAVREELRRAGTI